VKSPFGRGRRPVGKSSLGVRRRPIAVAAGAAAAACAAFSLALVSSAGAVPTSRTQLKQDAVATTTQAPYSDAPTLTPPAGYTQPANDGLGVASGKIKHVWMIVLENKSYDAAFTGLNDNTYLWKTLPSQGALLQNYYATGHSSNDNYLALASGQAPDTDSQDDCDNYDAFSGTVDTSGSLSTNPNFGQLVSAAGPNATPNANGCVYPKSVPTIFNQLDANHVSWKMYAQDLGNPDASGTTHDAGTQYCGADDPTVGPTGATGSQYTVHGSANATDQYVAYHNPLPWFESVLTSGDCNSQHLANLFSSTDGLYHDLQHASTTPAFSWITPDDCNDGHDAVCAGNNLSGGWANPTTPNAPVNYTGGLYSTDLFLEHVIPEIEASPAFRDGGLIDITFDESYPQFTYSNSFANSTLDAPTAATDLADDTAGETVWNHSVNYEPTGPNVPNVTASNGQQLSAGPGFNENLDRPSATTAAGTDLVPCTGTGDPATGGCYLGGGSNTPGARTDTASAAAGSSTIDDNSANLPDEGRTVSGMGIPSGAYVGTVTDTPVTATASSGNGGYSHTGSFALVNSSGQPLETTGAVTSVTLGAESAASDPLYDAYDPTTGGGDSGDVLISPYIKPGTVSTRYYNHYATLRTLEDIFAVRRGSPGLDGGGHIGYAAQPGLAPFGSDVFTNPRGEPVDGRGYSIPGLGSGHHR
jgi:Phosphoesterase family